MTMCVYIYISIHVYRDYTYIHGQRAPICIYIYTHHIHITKLHDIPKLEIDTSVILSILANNIGNPNAWGIISEE